MAAKKDATSHGRTGKPLLSPVKDLYVTPRQSLKEWFDSTCPPGTTKSEYAKVLAARALGKISASTILNTLKGQRLTSYAKGKAISDLTEGSVPVTDIVEF